jgi:hypothetical protein
MTKDVQFFSITQPEINPSRVLYYTEFEGIRSEPIDDYFFVLAHAKALLQEHGACLVDRSDKGTSARSAPLAHSTSAISPRILTSDTA